MSSSLAAIGGLFCKSFALLGTSSVVSDSWTTCASTTSDCGCEDDCICGAGAGCIIGIGAGVKNDLIDLLLLLVPCPCLLLFIMQL